MYGDRIRPLLEQQRQILVPYLPQREPHSDRVSPIAEHCRLGRSTPVGVPTRSARLRTNIPPTAPSAARPAVELVLAAHGEPRTARRSSACFPERRGRFLQLRRLAWASVQECPLLERSVRYGARRFAWRSSPVVIDDLDVVPVRV